MKLAVSEARVMTPHNSREKTAVHTPYSKMAAKLVFFLFSCKLALVALFLSRNSKEYFLSNEATRANMQINKTTPFEIRYIAS